MFREILQRCRDSHFVVSTAAHRRPREINDQIARVQEQIAKVVEELQDPGQPVNRRGELVFQRGRLVTLASDLRSEARYETRVIISISETLIDMPKKLGLALERREVGADDAVGEAIIKAIQDEPDRERRKKIIRAVETISDVLQASSNPV